MKQFALILLTLAAWQGLLIGQTCSLEQLQAKYWQYRENFNKHFVAVDRDSTGCVNDGIGFDSAASVETPVRCLFSQQGMSLPATSINIGKDGRGAIHARNGGYSVPPNSHPLYNPLCGGDISWNDFPNPTSSPKYNWLDIGSETLTQMGWYLVTLSTEYELLHRNGQLAEAQKTLEELFLALQAIRRLDMQAQCMVKVMYDERKCTEQDICPEIYHDGGNINGYCASCDIDVNCDCNFQPDYSGYGGFILRADATQDLEQKLHDPTSNSRYEILLGKSSVKRLVSRCLSSRCEIGANENIDFLAKIETQASKPRIAATRLIQLTILMPLAGCSLFHRHHPVIRQLIMRTYSVQ